MIEVKNLSKTYTLSRQQKKEMVSQSLLFCTRPLAQTRLNR